MKLRRVRLTVELDFYLNADERKYWPGTLSVHGLSCDLYGQSLATPGDVVTINGDLTRVRTVREDDLDAPHG